MTEKFNINEVDALTVKIFDANYGNIWAYHKSVWLEAYSLDIEV